VPRLRVASFNILHGQRGDGSGVVDHDLLGRSAASLGADVLALQEVDVGVPRSGRTDQVAVVAAATGLTGAFGRAARVGGIGKYGNALLSSAPLTDVSVEPLPKAVRNHEPRAVLLATTHGCTVAATHLSIHRPEVHEQLQVVVDALVRRADGGPCLLVGDLNLLPEEVEPVVAAAGLRLAPWEQPTFPNHEPRIRIDHVAVGGPGVAVASVDVVPTASSDHCALVVEVDVP
jgi:endonuclease/exonuclease/phosphatase family metal-dependent hydrolase